MSNQSIDPRHERAREYNRNKTTGEFQIWQAKEAAGVEPLQMPDPIPGRQEAYELFADMNNMAEAAQVYDSFDYIRTPAGQHLAYKHFAQAARNGMAPSSYSRMISRSDFHRFDELAELGWEEPSDVLRLGTRMFGEGNAVRTIADEAITPERLEKLRKAGASHRSGEDKLRALLDASDEELDAKA